MRCEKDAIALKRWKWKKWNEIDAKWKISKHLPSEWYDNDGYSFVQCVTVCIFNEGQDGKKPIKPHATNKKY